MKPKENINFYLQHLADSEHILDRAAGEVLGARIAELEKEQEQDRWIPVGERLPEQSGTYLTISFEGHSGSDLFWSADRKGWNVFGSTENRDTEIFPTHWRPMPKPPTKEADEQE